MAGPAEAAAAEDADSETEALQPARPGRCPSSEAAGAGPAALPAAPRAGGPDSACWRRAAVLAALMGVVAVASRRSPPLERGEAALAGRLGLGSLGCAERNGNCHASRCCLSANLTCYEKDDEWAACIPGCTPGVHEDWDPPEKRTAWSCRVLSDPLPGGGVTAQSVLRRPGDEEPAPEPAEAAADLGEQALQDASGSVAKGCHDVRGWKDQRGNSCAEYASKQLCTRSGDAGPGWPHEWGSLGDPPAGGLSGAHACCACGGGSAPGQEDGPWHLIHTDFTCDTDFDVQAAGSLSLHHCLDFCKDLPYAVFGISQSDGNCRCYSECSKGTHADHDLVYMKVIGSSDHASDIEPQATVPRKTETPPPDCAMHRGTEQLVPLYQSCRANNGTGRLEAKKKDVSIEDCMELARAACQSSFGMEYPSGYGGEDRAECVLGGGIADLIEVGDVDCTAWTNEGNPMGGAFRLAVYSVVGKKEAAEAKVPVPESAAIRSTTLFCFEVTVPSEADILDQTRQDSSGIFACDDYMVLRGSTAGRGQGGSANKDMTASWTNVQPFLDAWAMVAEDGRYKEHSWTVKVDPDAVFVPQQLKKWLTGKEPDSKGSYVSTCGTCESNSGFYGAMEVMSRVAAQRYVESALRCKAEFGDVAMNGWGEDLFAQRCMNLVGVTCWDDSAHSLVCDKLCGCWDGCPAGKAAYHPFKAIDEFRECTSQATAFKVDNSGVPV